MNDHLSLPGRSRPTEGLVLLQYIRLSQNHCAVLYSLVSSRTHMKSRARFRLINAVEVPNLLLLYGDVSPEALLYCGDDGTVIVTLLLRPRSLLQQYSTAPLFEWHWMKRGCGFMSRLTIVIFLNFFRRLC